MMLDGIKSIRINKCGYTFTRIGQRSIQIAISSFTNNLFFDGVSMVPYTFITFNSNGGLNTIDERNINGNYDVTLKTPTSVQQFTLRAFVDGIPCADIDQSNPLFLEIEFSQL